MEKRTLIAVILSLFVLIGWSVFFQQKPVPPQPFTDSEQTAEVRTEMNETAAPVPSVSSSTQVIPPVQPDARAADVTVTTDHYRAIFSTQGAVVKYWELTDYKDNEGKPLMLLKESGRVAPLGILLEGPDRNLPQSAIYSVNKKDLRLSAQGSRSGELIFSYSNGNISITKKMIFYNDDYKVNISVETVNAPSYMLPVGTDFAVYDKEQREHKGPVLLTGTDRKEFDDKLEGDEYFTENISWIAQEDKYFTAAIIPVSQIEGATVWKEGPTAEIALNLKSKKSDFIFYAGPKEYDRLKQLDSGLEHIVDFGWFSIVAMPLFWVLKFLYSYLGNYGWAIIILTIGVRIPFIPLMNKSQQSMKKMQKIQPMMAELKVKYKDDAAKMQKETMALYKKHKVNPVGGCLPMVLQVPVFIALYNVLLKAIELRGAPFALWITDLAIKDPYYVFPVLMGATMVLQQKMTPSTMDPKQAKMMMLMPIVFTFMFLSFPAGLVIYWLVNNILGIIQQYFVNKKAD